MPDDSAASEGDSSTEKGQDRGFWRGIRSLLFGDGDDHSLRKEIEDAIDEYDEGAGAGSASSKNGDLSKLERQMLRNLLHFGESDADDVAVPRGDIVAISESASFAELAALFADAGHSRVPVYRESLDTIVGMIHVKDAFAVLARGETPPVNLEPLMRQPLFVPRSMGALDLLAEMRAKRTHLAIVVDEYSGTDGLITIEDLVEEIVGDIEDEHDDEPEAMLIALEDGLWEADGRAELEEAAELIDPALAAVEEDVDTLGGLAFVLAGQVPEPGTCLLHEASGWRLEVLKADGRRVTRLRLHPPKDVARDGAG